MAQVPELLTDLCIREKPTDIEIRGSGVFMFLFVSTGYGNKVIIRSLPIISVNNADKDINQQLYLTHDCCEMTVDALLLGEIQLQTPKQSIPSHDGDLHLANHKLKIFRTLLMNRNGRLGKQLERICYL